MPYRSGLKAIQNPWGEAGGVDYVAIDLPTTTTSHTTLT
jgi:hypothetical protein